MILNASPHVQLDPVGQNMYRKLDVKSREIRLIEILPTRSTPPLMNNDANLAVRLVYCSLDDPAPYIGLSYTWGDPSNEALIRVDSFENVPVRRNVQKMLGDLRLQSRPDSQDNSTLYWIDAICINQGDLDERAQQVKLMRVIYAAASVVQSWIDFDVDANKTAFDNLERLSNDGSLRDLGESSDAWSPVGDLLANEYWYRIWVQQEIAFAVQWKVQCRNIVVNSGSLIAFAALLVLKQWGFFTDPLLNKASWKALMPNPLRPLLYQGRKNDGKISSSSFYGPLHRALRDCRGLRSTDPKDKIFAMLGMVDGYEDGDIEVNYHYTDEQVYTEVVKMSIKKYGSLDFLREATLGNVAQGHADFPTWLPDWSVTATMDQITSPSFSISDLYPEPHRPPTAPARVVQTLLHVKGCRICIVDSLLPKAQDESLWSGKIHIPSLVSKLRYFKTLSGVEDPLEQIDNTDVHEYSPEYLFRALIGADGRPIEDGPFQILSQIFEQLISAVQHAEKDSQPAVVTAVSAIIQSDQDHFGDIVHYMQESCRGRCLLLTDDLDMGLVPALAAIGDEIWYVLGCATPMTLRNEGERYAVVGEAYLNGCMRWRMIDGCLETAEGSQLPEYPMQDLILH